MLVVKEQNLRIKDQQLNNDIFSSLQSDQNLISTEQKQFKDELEGLPKPMKIIKYPERHLLNNYNPLQEFYQQQIPNKSRLSNSNEREDYKLVLNAARTQYTIVKNVCKRDFKMKIVDNSDCDNFDLMWADHAIPSDKLFRLKPHQRSSQLPGIACLTRKDSLAQNLNKMRQQFAQEYNFYPQTYLYPQEYNRLQKEWIPDQVLIVKPEASCQGKGIYLTRDISEIYKERCVVQQYLQKPLLMDKMKFDLRLYVLVLGVDPLRIYLSKEGLARLSTKLYDEANENNIQDIQMHLTNYAINKQSNKFQPNRAAILDSVGHKRSLQFALRYLEKSEKQDVELLMSRIKDLIIKTMICGQPIIASAIKQVKSDDYENSMFFQILGFDVILDHTCKPFLLEVNHSPSFTCDSPLDTKVKGDLIRDTVRLLGLSKKRKQMYLQNHKKLLEHRILNGKNIKLPNDLQEKYRLEFDQIRDQFETKNLGGFQKIYPLPNEPEFTEKSKQYKMLLDFLNQKNGNQPKKQKQIVSMVQQRSTQQRLVISQRTSLSHALRDQENIKTSYVKPSFEYLDQIEMTQNQRTPQQSTSQLSMQRMPSQIGMNDSKGFKVSDAHKQFTIMLTDKKNIMINDQYQAFVLQTSPIKMSNRYINSDIKKERFSCEAQQHKKIKPNLNSLGNRSRSNQLLSQQTGSFIRPKILDFQVKRGLDPLAYKGLARLKY